MKKYKLRNLFYVTALSDGQIATAIEKLTGKHFTSDLVTQAADGLPVSAIAADNICQWLSHEFGRPIKPDDIADLRIHPFSSSGSAQETMSPAVRTAKIDGFIAGFEHAFGARFNNQHLSPQDASKLAEQASSKRISVSQESVQPAVSQDAFYHACAFAGNAIDLLFDRPNGMKTFRELKAMDKGEREQYARNMARHYLDVM